MSYNLKALLVVIAFGCFIGVVMCGMSVNDRLDAANEATEKFTQEQTYDRNHRPTAELDSSIKCSPGFVGVTITNLHETKTLERSVFTFHAYRKGYSRDIAGSPSLDTDRIINPKGTWRGCYQAEYDRSSLAKGEQVKMGFENIVADYR